MHWNFGFNAKNLIFINKTMVLFQLLTCVFQLTIIIKGGKTPTFFWLMHWVLGFNAKKNQNKIEWNWILLDLVWLGFFNQKKENYEKPNCKKPCCPSPGFLRLKCFQDFASMLGLRTPCETGGYVVYPSDQNLVLFHRFDGLGRCQRERVHWPKRSFGKRGVITYQACTNNFTRRKRNEF